MLIGLVGKAGSGKDSVADHLVEKRGFSKKWFAGKLKEVVCDLFDLSKEQVFDTRKKEEVDPRYKMSPREILQLFGTDVCRNIYPNIWIDYLMRDYQKTMRRARMARGEGAEVGVGTEAKMSAGHPYAPPHMVVADVRFLNEAAAIVQQGGTVWRIVCSDNPKDLGATGAAHASEMEQEKIEVIMTLTARYGNLPHLYAQADAAIDLFEACAHAKVAPANVQGLNELEKTPVGETT